jgi:Zn-dependent protease
MVPGASLRLGKIKSIEISVNITWLVIFGLLVYWLKTGYVVENAPMMGSTLAWIVSALGALVLFGSVLAHELSHSLVALKHGLPIRSITLFIFGGVARMEREPRTPGVEFRMAIAGPLASLAIAAGFGFLRFVVLRGNAQSVAGLVTEYATYANLVLACFNLVPGFPLDGGRVLRALLWKVTGDFVRSTTVAATIGRIFGLVLVFTGVTIAVAAAAPGFLWLALIGTFLERLAYLSARRVRLMHHRYVVDDAGISRVVSATSYPERHEPEYGWYREEG